MNDDKALLNFNNASVELPIHRPTLGQDVIEVSSLGKSGAFTYDPGFMATAACESKITFIDGGKGVLLYRGYPIDQLAEKSDFMEVCYLILNGELPTQAGKTAFEKKVNDHMAVDPIIENIFKGFKKEAHPMAMITAAIASLAGLYHDQTNIKNSSDRMDAAIKFVAKIPTLTAMCYRHGKGETFLSPRKDLTYSENFIKPDIAFIFSLPLKEALKRVVKRYSGDEAKKTSFENRVIYFFLFHLNKSYSSYFAK